MLPHGTPDLLLHSLHLLQKAHYIVVSNGALLITSAIVQLLLLLLLPPCVVGLHLVLQRLQVVGEGGLTLLALLQRRLGAPRGCQRVLHARLHVHQLPSAKHNLPVTCHHVLRQLGEVPLVRGDVPIQHTQHRAKTLPSKLLRRRHARSCRRSRRSSRSSSSGCRCLRSVSGCRRSGGAKPTKAPSGSRCRCLRSVSGCRRSGGAKPTKAPSGSRCRCLRSVSRCRRSGSAKPTKATSGSRCRCLRSVSGCRRSGSAKPTKAPSGSRCRCLRSVSRCRRSGSAKPTKATSGSRCRRRCTGKPAGGRRSSGSGRSSAESAKSRSRWGSARRSWLSRRWCTKPKAAACWGRARVGTKARERICHHDFFFRYDASKRGEKQPHPTPQAQNGNEHTQLASQKPTLDNKLEIVQNFLLHGKKNADVSLQ